MFLTLCADYISLDWSTQHSSNAVTQQTLTCCVIQMHNNGKDIIKGSKPFHDAVQRGDQNLSLDVLDWSIA